MSPPAKARIGTGIPYLVRIISPRKEANKTARMEKNTARMTSCLMSLVSAPWVIFANGPMILNGPSMRKRKAKIWDISITI